MFTIDSPPICRVRQAFAQSAQALQTHSCRGRLGRARRSDSDFLLNTSEKKRRRDEQHGQKGGSGSMESAV